jgi:hypothetical protein
MPFNPLTNYCGEAAGFPKYKSTPAGGVTVYRALHVLAADLGNWIIYFLENPIDPYTQCGNLWEYSVAPFDKEAIGQVTPPGVASYQLLTLNLTYESQGMRFYPGYGVVKEEIKPKPLAEPVGVTRAYASGQPSLKWSDGAPVYYGEHPHIEWSGEELAITFPFAPSAASPVANGTVNSAPWTSFVLGLTFDAGTLKYAGQADEASVVIPAIGIATGLIRYRKTHILEFRDHDWNTFWRARDQTWNYMKDDTGSPYYQYPYANFAGTNWFV